MVGRMPVVFLHLEIPPEEVDVNVHPTKVEVRFRDPQRIYSHLLATLRQTFLKSDLHSRLQAAQEAPAPAAQAASAPAVAASSVNADMPRLPFGGGTLPVEPSFRLDVGRDSSLARLELTGDEDDRQTVASWFAPSQPRSQAPAPFVRPEPPSWAGSLPPGPSVGSGALFDEFADARAAVSPANDQWPGRTDQAPPAEVDPASDRSGNDPVPPPSNGSHTMPMTAAEAMLAAGSPIKAIQVHDSYLIAETGDGMIVIDQHALHERILYEELRTRVAAGDVESQRLLVPEPVDLPASEAALLLEQGELLARLGLEVESFGGDTVLVRSLPAMLPNVVPERLVRDLAEHLRTQPLPPTRDGLLAELLHMVACKAAVKAGQPLTPPEISALLERRHLVADSHHCPHGRPTALVFTKSDLEKQFGRI
jgi:DNA mismatch repair protein MutL